MDESLRKEVLGAQRNEITEYHVYSLIADKTKDKKNKRILKSIAADEMRHYKFWKSVSGEEVRPCRIKIWFFGLLSIVLGPSFGLRLMEKGEDLAQDSYEQLSKSVKGVRGIIKDEQKHEKELLSMLREERLEYASSIVLGLNDALVELTGALAGLTFVLGDGRIIATTGLITGIAAALSMAASGYLSSREGEEKNPIKSAIYTGVAYIITVLLLISPYFIAKTVFAALTVMLSIAVAIIFAYTFYITTAKALRFWTRFIEMAIISLTVAVISFGVGFVVKSVFGV